MPKYKTLWVDPPSGWMWGFPKFVDDEYNEMGEDKTEWYLKHGYPQSEIDAGMLQYIRCGLEKIDEVQK